MRRADCSAHDCARLCARITPHYDCLSGALCEHVDFRLLELIELEDRVVSLEEAKVLHRLIELGHSTARLQVALGAITFPDSPAAYIHTLSQLNRMIFGATNLEFAGRLRVPGDPDVHFGQSHHRRQGTAPEQIERELAQIYTDYLTVDWRDWDRQKFAGRCAVVLAAFLRVHPFHDGNGRVGRLFLRLMAQATGRFAFRPFPREADPNGRSWRRKYLDGLRSEHEFQDPQDLNQYRRKKRRGILTRALDALIYDVDTEVIETPPLWLTGFSDPPDSME